MADPDNPDTPMLSPRVVGLSQYEHEMIQKLREKIEELERQQKIDRKTDQHVQNLTSRMDKLDQMFPEFNEQMFVLDSQVDKLKKDPAVLPPSGSSGPSGAKSFATVPPDQTPNLYPAARRDAIGTLENDADEEMEDSEEEEEEEDSDEIHVRATYIEQQTAENLSKAKAVTSAEVSDLVKLLTNVVRQNVGLQYDLSRLKNDVKELRRQARLDRRITDSVNRRMGKIAFNHEIRVNTVEEHVRLISADTFLADYADYLDKRGYYFPDSLDKYVHRDRLTYPSHWSQGDPTRMDLESKSSNSAGASAPRSAQIPTTSSTTVTMIPTQSTAATTGSTTGFTTEPMNTRSSGAPTAFTRETARTTPATIPVVPQDDPLVESRSDFLWYTPHLENETPSSTQYVRHNLEIGFFKAKFLYGLFIKLRPIKNIREVASRPGAIPIVEALSPQQTDMTADNKVLLLEWQTNRAKKLNGVQRFKFDGVPIIPEGGNPPATTAFFLEEKEPIRVIQDKLPIRLMQYETSFGPTKKRLLKVAHVTLDNRRKYYIVCPAEYWPVYEIWEMNGPRPVQDRHTRVYRSPESPVSAIGSFTGNPPAYPGSSESVEDQEPEPDPDQEPEPEPMSTASLNPGASPFSPPQSDWNEASAFEDSTALKQFADFWQGDLHTHIVQNGNNFVCSLRLTINFPSLAVGQDSNSDQQILESHTHPNQTTAILGAHHMALIQIRRDFHPYWTMFVLRPVAYSEAYCQFLQSYLPKKTPDEKIRKWFEMRQSPNGITMCRVRYGEDMKSSESAQSTDPNEAREDASFLAMMQVQNQYPNCFLISRPSAIDDIDAMNSYVRIHSSFPDEALLERQNGSVRQWIFREQIVAEGSSQQASKTILSSMEIICRSRIQKRLSISGRFEQILRGDSSPSLEAAAAAEQHVVDPATAPTKASIRLLNLQHKAGRPSPPNSSKTATATAKLPDSDIEFGERKVMGTQRPPIVPQFSPGVQPQTSPVGRGPPELKQSPPKDAQGPVLRADSLPFVPSNKPVQRLPTGSPSGSLNANLQSGVKPMDVTPITQLSGPGQHISGPGQNISGPGDISGPGMQVSDLSKLSSPNASLPGVGAGKSGPGAMNISGPGDAVPQLPLVSNNSNVSDGLLPGTTMSVAPRSVASFLSPQPPEEKLSLPGAVKVYEDIGSPPVMFESKSTGTQRLQSWLQTQLKISLQKTEEFFRYFLQGEDIKCVFVFEQRDFAAFVASDKTKAKEGTCRIALLRLVMDNRYFKSFLVKVPPDTDGNPTSTLLQFFQTYSIHKQGDELQGIYRSYMHSTTGNTMPLFECRLTFKGVELGQGRGDTKRRAREEASRRVLRKLFDAINQLDCENVWRLTIKYKGADAILDPVVAASVGIVLNAHEKQPLTAAGPTPNYVK